jgi:hypothetical protein
MKTAQLLNDIEQLPPEAQQKIETFIISMKQLYQPVKNKRQPTITKGDKTIDPTEFFGMWKEQPKNLADIRKKAWHRSGFNQ